MNRPRYRYAIYAICQKERAAEKSLSGPEEPRVSSDYAPQQASPLADIYSERTGNFRDESVSPPIRSHLPDERIVSPGIDKGSSCNIS